MKSESLKWRLRLSPGQQCAVTYLENHDEVSCHELQFSCQLGNLSQAMQIANQRLVAAGDTRRLTYRKQTLPGGGWMSFWRLEKTGGER